MNLSQRRAAPALTDASEWLNSPPLTPDALRGRVVMYVFWTYTCINWLRALPYVRAWHAKYRDQGLVVIGIHTPEFEFEREIDHVHVAIQTQDVPFPVVLDSDYRIWEAFDNHYWPALYLADDHGVIRYSHFGEGNYAETERAVGRLLSEAGVSNLDGQLVEPIATGNEAPADWSELESPETYLGYARSEGFAGAAGAVPDVRYHYDVPPGLVRTSWALSGDWTVGPHHIAANQPGTSIAIRFHARDLHLVMAADADTPVRFRVTLDGQPPADAHGLDIDAAGAGAIHEPRMYQLIRQQHPVTDLTAELTFLDGRAEAYVITFG
jgi:thiol-disulfide isomerase/thioredoxin